MSAPIKDGGAAFPLIGVPFPDSEGHSRNPCDGYGWAQDPQAGMTLRDYFADGANRSGTCPYNQHEHEKCSEWAYSRADAMLVAREAQS